MIRASRQDARLFRQPGCVIAAFNSGPVRAGLDIVLGRMRFESITLCILLHALYNATMLTGLPGYKQPMDKIAKHLLNAKARR